MKKNTHNLKICFLAIAGVLSLPNLFGQAVTTLTFNYTGSIQNFTVPPLCVNSITIEARGAAGGDANGVGGLGAKLIGTFNASPGQVLKVLVGQRPSANGGGGGSFVTDLSNAPWIVAGGGGGGAGACCGTTHTGEPGQITTAGSAGVNASGGTGAGGVNGNGGGAGANGQCSGAGGGLLTAGSNGNAGVGAGGSAFITGGAGGTINNPGGFGGGGSSHCSGASPNGCAGGGGGGYSGGGSSGGGGQWGGGGSFNGGTNQSNTPGVQAGHGIVIISYSSGNAISVSASPTLICSGFNSTLTVTGPDNYSWSTGEIGTQISVSPSLAATYTVTGTDPVTGCQVTATASVDVLQSPLVSIFASKASVCEGESLTLQAFAGNSYTWSVGPAFTSVITVTPTLANNTYTVIGDNLIGCTAKAVRTIPVYPLPVVTVSGNTLICAGNSANLSASGAESFEWSSSNTYLQSNQVILSPNVTTTYSVIGTSSLSCKGTKVFVLAVDPCTGIENFKSTVSNVSVYPNPNAGIFTVSLPNGLSKAVEVVDVTGRAVLVKASTNDLIDVNISTLASGVYYVKVKSENVTEVVKVVKQ